MDVPKIKRSFATKEEIAKHIGDNYPMTEIINTLAELILNSYEEPIALSYTEYERVIGMFRLKGVTSDGRLETRGRKRKDPKETFSQGLQNAANYQNLKPEEVEELKNQEAVELVFKD